VCVKSPLKVIENGTIWKFGTVSYSHSIVTMAVSIAISQIFSVKEWPDFEIWVGVIQGHWKWHRSYDFLLVRHCDYSSILYHFWVIWHWI